MDLENVVVKITCQLECFRERMLWTLNCGELINMAINTHTFTNGEDQGQI